MKILSVSIGDYKVSGNRSKITTFGLGSCVAVIVYDPSAKVGGLAHFVLPDTNFSPGKYSKRVAKFGRLAVPAMVEEMEKRGAVKGRMWAKIVGGANMFRELVRDESKTIGARNIEIARAVLSELGIPIIAEDVGGHHGRSVDFYLDTGKVIVKSFQKGEKEI